MITLDFMYSHTMKNDITVFGLYMKFWRLRAWRHVFQNIGLEWKNSYKFREENFINIEKIEKLKSTFICNLYEILESEDSRSTLVLEYISVEWQSSFKCRRDNSINIVKKMTNWSLFALCMKVPGSALNVKTKNHVSAYFWPPMYVLKNHLKIVKKIWSS